MLFSHLIAFTVLSLTLSLQTAQAAQDRNQGQGAAQMASAAGAVYSAVKCIEYKRKADEAEAAGDQSNAALYSAFGDQQCAQALQNGAKAAENQQGKEKISDQNNDAVPTPVPTFAVQDDKPIGLAAQTSENTTPDPSPTLDLGGNKQTDSPTVVQDADEGDAGTTTLTRSDPSQLTYADTPASTAGGTTPSNMFIASSPLDNAKAVSVNEVKGTAASADTKGRRGLASITAGEGEAGGGSAAGGKSGGADMESLLSQMMGGGAQGGISAGMGGALDVIVLPKAESTAWTIFDYASYRYHKAADQEGRVHKKVLTSSGELETHGKIADNRH